MNASQIINDLIDKFSEHLEEVGDDAPWYLVSMLAQMLEKERIKNNFYKKTIGGKCECSNTKYK